VSERGVDAIEARVYRATMVRFAGGALVVSLLLAACGTSPHAAPQPLRIGIAAFDPVDPLANLELIAALGFDYVEPALSRLAASSDAEVAATRDRLRTAGLRAEAMNWFVPPEIKLTGPDVDDARVGAWIERALAIAESFGARVVVFGSPGARSFPDGFPKERAQQQLVAFLRRCAAVIAEHGYGMVIGIEALRRPESNIVNRIGEAVELARAVDRPQVRINVDFYHLTFEHEDPAVVVGAAPWIAHVQIADPRARGFPRSTAGEPRYAQFFQALRRAGYAGRVSIEGISRDLAADAPASLAFLREISAAP
jgi:sugar phosphate isomerase/epimerase